MEDQLNFNWILKPAHFELVESTKYEFLILGLVFNYFP